MLRERNNILQVGSYSSEAASIYILGQSRLTGSDDLMKGKLISCEPMNWSILAWSSKSFCDLHSRDLLSHIANKRSTTNAMSIICEGLNKSSITSFAS